MNCGRMRCQASDNFTLGSCIDKTLIYTDEMWFITNNIEEAKCILEGTQMYINIKHQNERILKRTPSLSTSNTPPWRVGLQDEDALRNRLFLYETFRPMPQLKEWGRVELNPLMWLTIWKIHIEKYVTNTYNQTFIEENRPKSSTLFSAENTHYSSSKKIMNFLTTKRKLQEELYTPTNTKTPWQSPMYSPKKKKSTRP